MKFENNSLEKEALAWWYNCTTLQATYYLTRLPYETITEILSSYVSYCRSNRIYITDQITSNQED